MVDCGIGINAVEKRMLAPFLVLIAMLFPVAAFANDAPGSIPYQGDATRGTDHAAFNVFSGDNIPGNPGAGGEQNFLTAAPSGQTNWSDSVNACDGDMVDLNVYVHNGAEVTYNGNNDGPGVALGSRLKVAIPGNTAESHDIVATLSADNVPAINDDATIMCNGTAVTVEYVAGSAEIYSQHRGVESLSDAVVGSNGTLIGSYDDNGMIPGCWEYRVWVKLTVKVKSEKNPPKPIVSCDALTGLPAAIKPGQKVDFTAKALAKNADITKYVFDFGDGSDKTVTTDKTQATATHVYEQVGTYTAKVTVHFESAGVKITKSGEKCTQNITVEKQPKPPVEPPEELPNTGIGGVITGVFGTGALGMSARSWLESRSMLRAGSLRKKED